MTPEKEKKAELPALSEKQKLFIDEWLRTRDKVQAASNAGYKGKPGTLMQIANRTLNRPNVKEYVRSKYKQHHITEEEVITRLAAIARGNVTDVLDTKRNGVQIDVAKLEKYGHLVSYFQRASGGGFTVRMYSAQKALEQLSKILGMEQAAAGAGPQIEIDLNLDNFRQKTDGAES